MSFTNQLIELTDINCREIESTPTIRKLLSGDVLEKHYVSFMTDIYPIVLHFAQLWPPPPGAVRKDMSQSDFIFMTIFMKKKATKKLYFKILPVSAMRQNK